MPSILIGSSGLMTPLNSLLSVLIVKTQHIFNRAYCKKLTSFLQPLLTFHLLADQITFEKGTTPSQKISGIFPSLISNNALQIILTTSGSKPLGPYYYCTCIPLG